MPRQRVPASPFRYFKTSPEVIRLAVMLYVKFPLSLRNVAGRYRVERRAICLLRGPESEAR